MPAEPSSLQRRHSRLEKAIFVLLVLLSLFGIVVTDFSQADGYGYWALMVIVFGVLSMGVSWRQAKISDSDFGEIVKEQARHWAYTLIVGAAAFLIIKSGHLSDIGASLLILLILALATMLDGVRTGWQFTLVGSFLAACAIIIAYVEQFIWACLGLAVLVIIGTFLWGFWLNSQSTAE